MCAIVASFKRSKFKELYRLNAYRGELSHSLVTFEHDNDNRLRMGVLFQDSGTLNEEVLHELQEFDGRYFIAHSQAPTTNTTNIHPAAYGDALLWHNGIIKQKNISANTWDTQWLLEQIIDYGWSSLSRVDGTFACVMFWGDTLYAFRNEISPLFIDRDLNISSTKFDGSYSLTPNQVHRLDIQNMRLYTEAYFETHENPYYIPGTV